jgi:predicted Ser/Thr protein kinase
MFVNSIKVNTAPSQIKDLETPHQENNLPGSINKISNTNFSMPCSNSHEIKTQEINKILMSRKSPIELFQYYLVSKGFQNFKRIEPMNPVYTAKKQDETVVIKFGFSETSNEYNLLKSLSHKNLPNVYDYYKKNIINDNGGFLKLECFSMQYLSGGDLFDFLQNNTISKEDAKGIIGELISVLSYLHANEIIHTDIRPQNIVFEGKTPYLIDLDSKRLNKTQTLDKNNDWKYMGSSIYQILCKVDGLPDSLNTSPTSQAECLRAYNLL